MNFAAARKIVVTGGAGFLGQRVVEELIAHGARRESILIPRSASDDLRELVTCLRVTEGAELVLHLAA
ncbi:MAG: KR domain-containing protein, partial [Bdellovibrionota bacterium]